MATFDLKTLSVITSGLDGDSILFGAKDGLGDIAPNPIKASAVKTYIDHEQATRTFTTRVEMAATQIAASTMHGYTAGYSSQGDGGGALYVRTGGTSLGGFQSADGSWWRIVTGAFNSVKSWGATGDGVTDDSAAIQAAIDTFKPLNSSAPSSGNNVNFPPGTYIVNTPLNTWSGITLRGVGAASIIKGGGSITGQLISLASVDEYGMYRYAGISDLSFEATGTVWAFKATAGLVLNCVFENIHFNCVFCMYLATYTQASVIKNITSVGAVDQILDLSGNFNLVEGVDKEAATGSSTDSYIYLHGDLGFCTGNVLRQILLEGASSVNKTPLRLFQATNTILDGFWFEGQGIASNGYSIELNNSTCMMHNNIFWSVVAYGKFKIINNSWLYIELFSVDGDETDWRDVLEVDASSVYHVNTMVTRRASDQLKVSDGNKRIDNLINNNLLRTPIAGYLPTTRVNFQGGQNLFINPSFEVGTYGWSFSGSASSELINSEVGVGLELHLQGTEGMQITQSISITAAQVGCPMTIRYAARCSANSYICPIIAGETDFGSNRITGGDSSMVVGSYTFIPQSAGAKNFGLWWLGVSGASDLWIDEMSLCFGTQAVINTAKCGSFELNGCTYTAASAAPGNGTWKVGDHVDNSVPTVGQPKGWVCTVAGSPGTWVSIGNL